MEVLKVKNIIICGHYECGSIKPAMEDQEHGLLDNWLRHVKDVHRFNAERFKGLTHDEKLDLLCEINVKEQVTNICNTTIVQNAWKQGCELSVHGRIYSMENGILKDLDTCVTSSDVNRRKI